MQDIQGEFGRRVRVARVERSWTQARLAERLHTTTRTVSKIERGQINISLDTIRAYACELDLSLDDLIRDASPDMLRVLRFGFRGHCNGDGIRFIVIAGEEPAIIDLL